MDNSYGREKLQNAVLSLDNVCDQRTGLLNAVVYSLIHIDPDRDLPVEIQSEFKCIMKELRTATPQADEGRIRATINEMDDTAVRDLVTRIAGLYGNLSRRDLGGAGGQRSPDQ